MADLQSCYFCGTGPGGSIESYGVVPSALDPSPEEQRSVVLCPDCREKLTALLRPVVVASGTEPATTVPSPTEGSDDSSVDPVSLPDRTDADEPETDADERGAAGSDETASPDHDEESRRSEADSSTDPTERERGSTGRADDTSGRSITFEGAADGESAGDSGNADAATGPAGDGDAGGSGLAGASTGAGEPTRDDGGAGSDAGRGSGSGSTGASGGSGGSAGRTDGSSSDSAGESDAGSSADPANEDLVGNDNDAYRKVIRLLQNREFPVRRVEIEDLASNAYKLSPRECSDAIDAVIQKGLLVEEDGMLRRPGN